AKPTPINMVKAVRVVRTRRRFSVVFIRASLVVLDDRRMPLPTLRVPQAADVSASRSALVRGSIVALTVAEGFVGGEHLRDAAIELGAGASDATAYRSDRQIQSGCDLVVLEVVELAEDQHLAMVLAQAVDDRPQHGPIHDDRAHVHRFGSRR